MSHYSIKENSRLAQLAAKKLKSPSAAMVLGHTIHLSGISKKDFLNNKCWLRHELKHIEQYERYGFFGFLVRYLWQTLRKGYYNCGLECEARAAEADEEITRRYQLLEDGR